MNFNEANIESYLTGKLSAADKIAMEAQIGNDPMLKSEVDLQNDIIESLKEHRKIQLKNRLNNINVTSTTTTGVSSAIKIAASFITVGMIGAGFYYFTVFSDQEKENVSVVVNENIVSPKLQNGDSNLNVNTTSSTVQVEVLDNNSTTTNNTRTNVPNVTSAVTKKQDVETTSPQANVPTGVIADTESDRLNRDLTIIIPTGDIAESNIIKTEKVDVKVDDNNKNDFSYKLSNNKLFLYGDFKDQPYNLVEINSSKSKQLYLFFDSKYYELKANQTKVTRLKEVKDATILKHLNK